MRAAPSTAIFSVVVLLLAANASTELLSHCCRDGSVRRRCCCPAPPSSFPVSAKIQSNCCGSSSLAVEHSPRITRERLAKIVAPFTRIRWAMSAEHPVRDVAVAIESPQGLGPPLPVAKCSFLI